MMESLRSLVRLADGRDLDVLVGGAASGQAFLMLNGTPAGLVARPRLLDGEGHLSLAVSAFERILDELVEAGGRESSSIMPPGP